MKQEKKKKILVVDDSKTVVKVYELKLLAAGFEVATAEDGEEGLLKVTEFLPDLILLDVIMPKKDGFQVMEALHADKKLSKIPVLVFSTLNQDADMERIKSLGVKGCMPKSDHSPTEIIEEIKRLLS